MRIRDPYKQRIYAKRHYERNRPAMIARAKLHSIKSRQQKREWRANFLKDRFCIDCGESDPVVLDFDHRGDKQFNIGDAIRDGIGLDRVKREAEKCDVRCSNCHRRKTHRERTTILGEGQ